MKSWLESRLSASAAAISFLIAVASFKPLAAEAAEVLVYSNDFSQPAGTRYPEWSSSAITYSNNLVPRGSGTLAAPIVSNTEAPNHAEQFLGLFGGPPIGSRDDHGWNHTRVNQTVTLTLTNLPPHQTVELTFDLYIIRSWDGNSPAYGPDRFILSVVNGPLLLDTTFSNNPKTATDRSFQNYPLPNSPPWSGAISTNRLGYDRFFRDSMYRLHYSFSHAGPRVSIDFTSSLFEGKGTADEAWGLDNVRIQSKSEQLMK